MTITLTPEQQAWIDVHVAQGKYLSVEDAARRLLDDAITSREIEDDDLSWAKPYVEEAKAEVDRGETMSAEESRAELFAFLETLEK